MTQDKYYEEIFREGELFFRTSPNGEWLRVSRSTLLQRVIQQRSEIYFLREENKKHDKNWRDLTLFVAGLVVILSLLAMLVGGLLF